MQWVADFYAVGNQNCTPDELVVDGFVDEGAAAGDAALAGVGEDAGGLGDCEVHPAVLEDDVGGFAAEL